MFQEALEAVRRGQRTRARDLFTRLLRSNSSRADYWLWMSTLVDSQTERIFCLESAIKADPDNEIARRGLILLGARTAGADVQPVPPITRRWDKELEKELNDYLARKYGNRIKLSTPLAVPRQDEGLLEGEGEAPGRSRTIAFDSKPEELEAYLDQFVVKQDDAKEVLATKICTHFKRIHYRESGRKRDTADRVGMIKNNIIMIGPTGVGKTYLIKLIAKKIGVPFVKGDATKFSETGYVGGDVEDLVRDLVREADGDMERAQYGIIYIDEIDKIASGGAVIGIDVSRTGVQRCLLKPMEEAVQTPITVVTNWPSLLKK